MRKIVTGDQVAQLRNPEPFAFPRWRAPVYRTPAAIVMLAQLFRFVFWRGWCSGTRSRPWCWPCPAGCGRQPAGSA
jgi:hypothetical protein